MSISSEGTFGGFMPETATPGRYRADIDTNDPLFGAGTFVLTIQATASQYNPALTTVTLIILSLPSDMIILEPTTGVVEVSRGNPVDVSVQLNDTLNVALVGSLTDTAYILFEGNAPIPLTWNGIAQAFEGKPC